MTNEQIINAVHNACQDNAIRDRSYYPDFRRSWDRLFDIAFSKDELYTVENEAAVYTVEHSFSGIDAVFHFDLFKMADWYNQEQNRRKRLVFIPKKFKRASNGTLSYHDSICTYDPHAVESVLSDDIRNIFAVALPGLPPELKIVYGNKWVNTRTNVFKRNSISLFLLETDYVPAFLASPVEICLYLYMMDLCIIKENYQAVKDEDLKQYLHIFRPSPMLKIKGLL